MMAPTRSRDQKDSREKPRTRYTVSLPWLIGTVVFLAILVPSAYGWHAYQVKRMTHHLKERVDRLEEEGKLLEAANLLFRYLQENEEDVDQRVRLARLYDKGATTPRQKQRAAQFYYQAAGHVESDPELEQEMRRRVAELYLELRLFPDAAKEAERLVERQSDDAAAWRVLALARFRNFVFNRTGKSQGAGKPVDELLLRALELNEDDITLASAWANLLRTQDRELESELSETFQAMTVEQRAEAADVAMDKTVQLNPDDVDAWLSRYLYRDQFGLDGGAADLAKALELAPDDTRVLFIASQRQRQLAAEAQGEARQEHIDNAIAYLRRVTEQEPDNEAAYAEIGDLLAFQGEDTEALAVWEAGLDAQEEPSPLLMQRYASALLGAGRREEAREVIDRINLFLQENRDRILPTAMDSLGASRDLLEAKYRLAENDWLGAASLLRRIASGVTATRIDRRELYETFMLLGQIDERTAQWDRAATAYERAENYADIAEPALRAAAAWMRAGQPDRAASAYSRALAIDSQVETRIRRAAAQLSSLLRSPGRTQAWNELESDIETLEASDETIPNRWRIPLLRVNYLWARAGVRGTPESVRGDIVSRLDQAKAEYGEDPEFIAQLLPIYQRLGMDEQVDQSLAELENLTEDPVAVALAKTKILIERGKADEAKVLLQEAMKRADADGQSQLADALASLEEDRSLETLKQEAVAGLEAFVERNPTSVPALFRLANLRLDDREYAVVEELEQRLRDAEGEDGVHWRYLRARRLVAQSEEEGADKASLIREAEELQSYVMGARPRWDLVYALRGVISEKRGDDALAIQSYRQAVEFGSNNVATFVRLIQLLQDAGRESEAIQFQRIATQRFPSLAQVFQTQRLPEPHRSFVKDFLEEVGQRDIDAANSVGKKWIAAAQEDGTERGTELLRGVLTVIGKVMMDLDRPELAEPYLRKLSLMGPAHVYPLAVCLARQDEVDQAIQLCLDAVEEDEENRPDVALALFMLLAQVDPSEDLRPAVEAAKSQIAKDYADNAAVLINLANVYLGRDGAIDEAMALYRQVLAMPEQPSANGGPDAHHLLARNNLAMLVAEEHGAFDEAVKLIDEALAKVPENATFLDTKALILALAGRAGEALPYMEEAARLANEAPQYLFHLAGIQKLAGQDEKAAANLARVEDYLREQDLDKLAKSDRVLLEALQWSPNPTDASTRDEADGADTSATDDADSGSPVVSASEG